jgi:hypothetical protein
MKKIEGAVSMPGRARSGVSRRVTGRHHELCGAVFQTLIQFDECLGVRGAGGAGGADEDDLSIERVGQQRIEARQHRINLIPGKPLCSLTAGHRGSGDLSARLAHRLAERHAQSLLVQHMQQPQADGRQTHARFGWYQQ